MIMHKTVHTAGLILAESADFLIIQLTLFMKKILIALSTLTIIILLIFYRYGNNTNNGTYNISISYISPLKQNNNIKFDPSYQTFNSVLAEWKSDHQGTEVEEITYLPSQYGSQITYWAAIGKLPDIFVFAQCNTKAWTDVNMLLDVSDSTVDYDHNDLMPLTRDGKVYGFPVYNISSAVICYDQDVWNSLGYSSFPSTWPELKEAKQKIIEHNNESDKSDTEVNDDNYLIVFGSGEDSKGASTRDILFTLCGRNMDSDWFEGLIAGEKRSSFINSDFINMVNETGDILTSGIFNEDLNEIDDDTARERFISGDAPAFLGSIADAEYIMEKLKGTDRYNNLRFAPLPAVSGEPKTISAGFDYALGINADVDPEKADLLKDLCRTLTGQTYADIAWSEMPVYGTTKPSDISLSSFNEVQKSLYHAVYDCEHTPLYSSYLDSSVNDSSSLSDVIDGKMQLQEYEEETSAKRTESTLNPPHVTTARDYAYRLQDTYEANYFTMADY